MAVFVPHENHEDFWFDDILHCPTTGQCSSIEGALVGDVEGMLGFDIDL